MVFQEKRWLGGMEESSQYEMLTKNLAGLLKMRVEEVREVMLPEEHEHKEDPEGDSLSGTSDYWSQAASPPPGTSYLRRLRGRGHSDSDSLLNPPAVGVAAEPAARTSGADDGTLAEIQLELARSAERRVPKPGYLCRICFQPGHLIFDCPQKHLTPCATPYKGPKQCYGEFQCAPCKRKWRSGKSFANQGQPCKGCGHLVFPHRQYSLEKAMEEGKWPVKGKPVLLNALLH